MVEENMETTMLFRVQGLGGLGSIRFKASAFKP